MFSILKLIIWIAGVITIASFALPYFGYAINTNYWSESKSACQEKLNQCQKDLLKTGPERGEKNMRLEMCRPKSHHQETGRER
jgi:hypothetical protein